MSISFPTSYSDPVICHHSNCKYTVYPINGIHFFVEQTRVVTQCCIKTIDDEEFDIYPLTLLFYNTFLFAVTLLILVENHMRYDSTSLSQIQFDTHSSIRYAAYPTKLDTFRWIIVYCVIFVVSGESYFHFYLCYVECTQFIRIQSHSFKSLWNPI